MQSYNLRKKKKQMKVNDEVWHRVVQIVQEAIITGIDCTDLFREIELEQSPTDNSLVLSAAYKEKVVKWHQELLDRAAIFQLDKN